MSHSRGDNFSVMGFGDAEPAAINLSADGLVLVAEDEFHILLSDHIGQVEPLILEPSAEVLGDLVRIEEVFIRFALLWLF